MSSKLRKLFLLPKYIKYRIIIRWNLFLWKAPFGKNEQISLMPFLYMLNPAYSILNAKKSSNYKVDCSFFFNEIEILELRLKYLYDVVDKFIVVEAKFDLSGKAKPLHLSENLDLFKPYLDKLEVLVLEYLPNSRDEVRNLLEKTDSSEMKMVLSRTLSNPVLPRDGSGPTFWLREFFFKEMLLKKLNELELPADSHIYISDVDEIWNRKIRVKKKLKRPMLFKQTGFVYFMNNKVRDSYKNWTGTCVATLSQLNKHGLNTVRSHGIVKRDIILFGGWHFSAMGGVDRVKEKIEIWDPRDISKRAKENLGKVIRESRDIRGRDEVTYSITKKFPADMEWFKQKYPEFFK